MYKKYIEGRLDLKFPIYVESYKRKTKYEIHLSLLKHKLDTSLPCPLLSCSECGSILATIRIQEAPQSSKIFSNTNDQFLLMSNN